MALSPANMIAEILRKDLSAFIHRSFIELNPHATFLHNWHHDELADALLDIFRGRCRLIVNLPPRHLKSHAISIALPAWILGHRPWTKILTVSYAQDLSDTFARNCRTLMMSPFYQALFDTRLSPGREAVSDFETTAGGYRLSTSVGGVLTGRGADIIIIDDPLKADDALSDARRTSVNEWYDNTLRSRLNSQENGSIIIVMQRLHADDLVAHILANEEEIWQVLSFPAIEEEDWSGKVRTPYGYVEINRKKGDVLQPNLMSRAALKSQEQGMTAYNFAAQYQQNPEPPSGVIVKREWLKYYSPEEKPNRFDIVIQAWDTALKATELADYNVCTTWGFKSGKLYLLDVFRKKMEFPDLKKSVRRLADLHGAKVVLVEDKGSGTSLIQQLRAEHFSIVQEAPAMDGDKIMRLRSQTAKIEGGFVLFPKKADWLDAFVKELISFPNAKNDDQVDSAVYALAWLTSNAKWSGWTAESLQGLENLINGIGWNSRI